MCLINKSNNSLRRILNKTKSYQPQNCNKTTCTINCAKICFIKKCVYKLSCTQCNKFYIGSTIQNLHDRTYQNHNDTDSAINEHRRNSHNGSSTFTCSVIARCKTRKEVLFKEALLIRKWKPTNLLLNRKKELEDVLRLINLLI